jgi:hypothetical protein
VNPAENILKFKDTYDSVGLKYGNHCTLPISYDWEFIRIILSSFVDSTLHLQKKIVWSPSNPVDFKQLKKVNFEVAEIHQEGVLLKLQSGNDKNSWLLPYSETPFVAGKDSPSYQDMVRRWVHSNIHIWMNSKNQIYIQRHESISP